VNRSGKLNFRTLGLLSAVLLAMSVPLEIAATGYPVQSPAPGSCGTLTIAAAADLSEVMNTIAADFRAKTGCVVRLSTGSSGNFLSQIENGAPFDLFFSADFAYPKKLESEGLAVAGSTYLYAIGKIVLWVRNDSRLDVSKGLEALRDPAIQQLAIANPQHAPYGRAAEQALRNAGVYDALKDRLVLGENISQAAQFVESGNANAGILALSSALSGELKKKGHYSVIPQNLYSPLDQGAVIMRSSKNPQAAEKFLASLQSPETRELLAQYGFALPPLGAN